MRITDYYCEDDRGMMENVHTPRRVYGVLGNYNYNYMHHGGAKVTAPELLHT